MSTHLIKHLFIVRVSEGTQPHMVAGLDRVTVLLCDTGDLPAPAVEPDTDDYVWRVAWRTMLAQGRRNADTAPVAMSPRER